MASPNRRRTTSETKKPPKLIRALSTGVAAAKRGLRHRSASSAVLSVAETDRDLDGTTPRRESASKSLSHRYSAHYRNTSTDGLEWVSELSFQHGNIDEDGAEMLSVCKNPEDFDCFLQFLASVHAEESLMFWNAVETMKINTEYAVEKGDSKRVERACVGIFQSFIGDDAEFEVNISSTTMKRLQDMAASSGKHGALELATAFTRAQTEIFQMLLSDQYHSFKESEYAPDGLRVGSVLDESIDFIIED